MKNYYIKYLNYNNKHSVFVICLSCDSFLDYIDNIENEIHFSRCLVIIDQLFITGNSDNRFLHCEFEKGKLLLNTAKKVSATKKLKTITCEYIKDNKDLLINSSLTMKQRRLILDGNII